MGGYRQLGITALIMIEKTHRYAPGYCRGFSLVKSQRKHLLEGLTCPKMHYGQAGDRHADVGGPSARAG